MFVVAAKIKAKEDHAEELADMFRDMVAWVTQNEGETVTYTCNRSTQDGNVFFFFERYTSMEAFQQHASSERFLHLASRMQGLIDGPLEVETYEEIAAKI